MKKFHPEKNVDIMFYFELANSNRKIRENLRMIKNGDLQCNN